MRELKAYSIIGLDGRCNRVDNVYYLKSEADKVIEEKDSEIARLNAIRKVHVEAIESMGAGLLQDDNKLRHQKYKRCLAMAMWCHNQREIYERDSYDWELEYDAKDTLRNKANIMRKWRKRWLKLAEKFKEAK